MRVALLVDGDNISAQHSEALQATARALGQVDILRCYLNAQKPSPWLSQPAFRHIHAGTGKNGSDLLLTIEAMELAYAGRIDAFVIASSDSDFSHLARHMREKGLHVQGMGEPKTSPCFRAACTTFTVLGRAVPNHPSSPPPAAKSIGLEEKIRRLIAVNSREGKGMKLTELAPRMNQLHGVRISAEKEKTWRAFFLARPHLFEIDPRGTECHVRYRPQGFSQ